MENSIGEIGIVNSVNVPTILLILITLIAIFAAIEDSRSRILPDRLTATIGVLSIALVGTNWDCLSSLDLALWAGVVVVHVVLVIAPPYGLGGGDLKLIAGLGLGATYLTLLIPWLILSYSLAALEGLRRRFFKDSSTLAFGPWLVTAWIVIFVGESARVAMANCR